MALLSNVVGYGLLADRPSAGAEGALYFVSDTGQTFRDNGTTWDEVANRATSNAVYDATGSALVAWPGELISPPFGS